MLHCGIHFNFIWIMWLWTIKLNFLAMSLNSQGKGTHLHTILNLHPPACCVVWHGNMQMHIWRPQASSSVPLDRDQKCNSGHPSLLALLFHGLSDYIENLGWCNGKIDKGTDLNTQTILSSLSASPEDTSLLAL